MKTFRHSVILSSTLFMLAFSLHAQPVNFRHLISMASMQQQKCDAYIAKKNFYQASFLQSADTVNHLYLFTKPVPKKNKKADSTDRRLVKSIFKDECFITYQTTSYDECIKMTQEMKEEGFYCNEEADSLLLPLLLYQKGDITVKKFTQKADSIVYYCMTIYQKTFPNPGDIIYADDLMPFTSHEYLEYYFGAPNVKKDIYYLSGNEMVRCSVLFSNSPRQVVFIWKDEINRTGIASLLFGGQQKLKSAIESSSFVAESNWLLKSGVHAGMTLYELRTLNGSNFQFYGGNSAYTGSVVPGNKGKLDFKKEDIILSCINCKDNQFYSSKVLDADEAIDEGRIVFVLSVMLNPSPPAGAAMAVK